MHGTLDRITDVSRQRRRRTRHRRPTVSCEALEERALLSGLGGAMGEMGLRGSRAAEMSSFGAGRQDGMFGGGSLGLGGGMIESDPSPDRSVAGGWQRQHDAAVAAV